MWRIQRGLSKVYQGEQDLENKNIFTWVWATPWRQITNTRGPKTWLQEKAREVPEGPFPNEQACFREQGVASWLLGNAVWVGFNVSFPSYTVLPSAHHGVPLLVPDEMQVHHGRVSILDWLGGCNYLQGVGDKLWETLPAHLSLPVSSIWAPNIPLFQWPSKVLHFCSQKKRKGVSVW